MKAMCNTCKDLQEVSRKDREFNYKGDMYEVKVWVCNECGSNVAIPHSEVEKYWEGSNGI